MCWNKQVSLATFILAMIGVIYLYKRNRQNDRWIAVFAATVAMIQLAEFFMWSDPKCGNMNKYACIFALLVLGLEPLMNMIGGVYFSNTPNKNVLRWMIVAYVIFVAYFYFSQVANKDIDWCGTSGCGPTGTFDGFSTPKGCNLQWYFTKNFDKKLGIIWILFLLIPFLTMTPKYMAIMFFVLGFATMIMAKVVNTAALGSLWCWFAIGLIFLKIFVY